MNERIALGATFLHRLYMQIMQFLIMVQRHILPAIRTTIMALVEQSCTYSRLSTKEDNVYDESQVMV